MFYWFKLHYEHLWCEIKTILTQIDEIFSFLQFPTLLHGDLAKIIPIRNFRAKTHDETKSIDLCSLMYYTKDNPNTARFSNTTGSNSEKVKTEKLTHLVVPLVLQTMEVPLGSAETLTCDNIKRYGWLFSLMLSKCMAVHCPRLKRKSSCLHFLLFVSFWLGVNNKGDDITRSSLVLFLMLLFIELLYEKRRQSITVLAWRGYWDQHIH